MGDVATNGKNTLLTVCPFILANEFCERLAYNGLATNLINYIREVMGADPGHAAIQVMLFEGTCYLTPVLGAWVADSYWGRYYTILVFSLVYVVGTTLLALSALVPGLSPGPHEDASVLHKAFLYTSLYVIAVGTGGIKPNVSAFGADQFDESDPQDRKAKRSFFNWFYFAINLGSLIAVTVVVYIQEYIGWGVGFAIPAVAMVLGIVMYLSGTTRYVHVQPTESPLSRVFRIVWAAIKANWAQRGKAGETRLDVEEPLLSNSNLGGMVGAMRASQSLAWLDKAATPRPVVTRSGDTSPVPGFSLQQVDEVKLVLRMLPVFFTTILYWTIYIQMNTFFVEQGTQMDRNLFGGKFYFPAASLALFNTLSIIILIPVYDGCFIPLLNRLGKRLTLLQRIGWGLVVAAFSMFVAAAVEYVRLKLYQSGAVLPSSGRHDYEVVAMSVFWQVPQYLLIGLSEVLTSIGQLEFFYDQAPDVMRSCSMALQLLSVCIGSYLSGALVWLVGWVTSLGGGPGWLAHDLNKARLDLFFVFMGVLMLFGLLMFILVAVNYQYKEVEHIRAHPRVAKVSRPVSFKRDRPLPSIPILSHPTTTDEDGTTTYSRSVTFAPNSPALPAPLR